MADSDPSFPADGSSALVGGTIYVSPAEEPIRDGVVLLRSGKISEVGGREVLDRSSGAPSVDCSGLSIAAGFWNSHVHFFERKWADAGAIPAPELARQIRAMLTRYGFTSVFDLGSPWENTARLRSRIDSGEVPGPQIRSTGPGLIAPGAGPADLVLAMMGVMKTDLPEVADANEAATAAKKLLDAGVDGIKIFLKPGSPGGPSFPEGGIAAASGEARRAGKPLFAHPTGSADVIAAAQGGVGVIAHTTPHSGPWDEGVLGAMSESRVALTPTLALWKHFSRHDRVSAAERITGTAVGQLRAWNDAGGEVLFGTDLGAAEYDPSDEYALMGEAGMSFRQILASLTTVPAAKFGDSARVGRIAAGYDADLVVFRGDPTLDIRALADVRWTFRGGRVLYRAC